jgi:polysaccharide biosynthesis/export protein
MSSPGVAVLALLLTGALGSAPGLAQMPNPTQTPSPTAAAAVPSSAPNGAPRGTVDPREYRIGPDDVLQISVWRNEGLSRTVTVRQDGKITMPLLNDVEAAGLTPMELRELLARKFENYMAIAEVSVTVADPRSFKVSVLGEVPKPGRYELRARTTVLDALALAGGLSPFAMRAKIFVLRQDGENQKRLPFNFLKAVSVGGEQENFSLQPGDIVVVP